MMQKFTCIGWLLLCAFIVSGCKDDEKQARTNYVKAFQLEEAKPQQALPLYQQILNEYPGTVAALEATRRIIVLKKSNPSLQRSGSSTPPKRRFILGLAPPSRPDPSTQKNPPPTTDKPVVTGPVKAGEHSPVHIFSWWRKQKMMDVVFVLDQAQPNAEAQWKWSCSFRSKNSTRTKAKDGIIKSGKSGYTWKVIGLWVGSRETGECEITVSLHGKVWRKTIQLKRPDTVSSTNFIKFQSRLYEDERKRFVIAFVKSMEMRQDIQWSRNCFFQKKGSSRTTTKSGKASTGRWSFKPVLFFLYKYKNETAKCNINITQGTQSKEYIERF